MTSPDKQERLRACPFCGRAPKITTRAASLSEKGNWAVFIACHGGGYSAHAHHASFASSEELAMEGAITSWNQRALDAASRSIPAGEDAELVRRLNARSARLNFIYKAQNAGSENSDAGLMLDAAARLSVLSSELEQVRALSEDHKQNAQRWYADKLAAEALARQQAEEIGRLRAALKPSEEALRPFYDAVFNDNGDITVTGNYDYEEAVSGYFAYRLINAALSKEEQPAARTASGDGQ